MIVKYKAYSFLVSKYIKRRRETWEKIQEHVNLEETDNTFICNKCKSVIHFEKLSDDRSQIRFSVNSIDEDK